MMVFYKNYATLAFACEGMRVVQKFIEWGFNNV
jgi:hypothetical protein